MSANSINPASVADFTELPADAVIYLESFPGKTQYVRAFIPVAGVLCSLNCRAIPDRATRLVGDRYWWHVKGTGFSKTGDIAEDLRRVWQNANKGQKVQFQFITL